MRPVAEIMYSDFLTLAMDPIVNQAAKMRYMFGGQASVPLVVRTNSGAPGNKAAQHSQSLEAWFLHVPGLKVVTPATPADAKGLLDGRDPRPRPGDLPRAQAALLHEGRGPRGRARAADRAGRVVREGRDLTVVANQTMVLQRARGGGRARRRGHRARGDRRPDDQPARHGHDQRERAQDRAA